MTASELDALNRERVVARLLPAAVHDVRNALQGISGAAELLTLGAGLGPEPVVQRAGLVLRQTALLGERLDRLLQLQSDLPAAVERLDLARVVSHALSLRQASWARLLISARSAFEPGVAIQADLTHTVRILANLLLNAEAGLRMIGGGTITFTAGVQDEVVTLVVEDSGPGVTEAAEPWLFSARTQTGGLATGLAVSRRLAEGMGGGVRWLGPERRAAFEVRLPSGR